VRGAVSFTLGVRTSETPAVVVARLDRATQYAAAKRFKFSAPANYREVLDHPLKAGDDNLKG